MGILNNVQNIFKKTGGAIDEHKDPICGMKVNLDKAEFKSTYEGKEYGFCSASCKVEFDSNPGQYAVTNG